MFAHKHFENIYSIFKLCLKLCIQCEINQLFEISQMNCAKL
jgi:hypothetical protein